MPRYRSSHPLASARGRPSIRRGAPLRVVADADQAGALEHLQVLRNGWLWEATTTPERLARWFLPVEGDLKLGGRYQLEGNAGGTITRCDPPEALDMTWEFGGGTSWVNLRLAPDGQNAEPACQYGRKGIGHTARTTA